MYFILLIFLSFSVYAEEKQFSFEPIYGLETSMVRYPEPSRYVTRATYGMRFTYGSPLLSGEGEYSEARSRNEYPSINQKVDDKSERYSLGVRSNLTLSEYLGGFFRGGLRASSGETVVTTNGVANHVHNPFRLDPYAGAGLQLIFGTMFNLNAGVTLIRNQLNQYDTQYTLGLNTRL